MHVGYRITQGVALQKLGAYPCAERDTRIMPHGRSIGEPQAVDDAEAVLVLRAASTITDSDKFYRPLPAASISL